MSTVSGSWIYQESADILSKLALSGRGAVVVLDDLVVEWRPHANGAAREVRVEVLTLTQLNSRWRVAVAVEQVVDVVLAPMSVHKIHIMK